MDGVFAVDGRAASGSRPSGSGRRCRPAEGRGPPWPDQARVSRASRQQVGRRNVGNVAVRQSRKSRAKTGGATSASRIARSRNRRTGMAGQGGKGNPVSLAASALRGDAVLPLQLAV